MTGRPNMFVLSIAALVAMFAISLSWYTVTAWQKTNIHRFDLGNVEQVVWNVTNGHGFVMTDPYGTASVSRFAFHSDPFLLLLVPWYAIWPATETLIIFQILALASGIIAAALLGRRVIHSSAAGLVAGLAYVLSVPVLWAAIEPVHAVSFALPLILWLVWATEAKRWWLMVIFSLLLITTKEQVGLAVGLFAVWLIIVRHQRRWGLAVMLPGLAWSLFSFLWLMPHYRPLASQSAEVYQSVLGNSASAVIRGAVTKPLTTAKTILGGSSRQYIIQLIGTTGGLALLNPISLAAVPDMVINGLSSKPQQHQLMFHYHGSLWPWLFVGTLFGWAWLVRWAPVRWRSKLQIAIPVWFLLATALSAYLYSPLPGAKYDRLRFATWRNTYAPLIRDLTTSIPADARLSTTNNVGAHFARRRNLYLFPNGVQQADYLIVLTKHGPPVIATEDEVAAALAEVREDPAWEQVQQTGELTVLRRKK